MSNGIITIYKADIELYMNLITVLKTNEVHIALNFSAFLKHLSCYKQIQKSDEKLQCDLKCGSQTELFTKLDATKSQIHNSADPDGIKKLLILSCK